MGKKRPRSQDPMAKPWIPAGALPPPTGDQSSIMLHRRMPITQKLGEMTKVCCSIFQLACFRATELSQRTSRRRSSAIARKKHRKRGIFLFSRCMPVQHLKRRKINGLTSYSHTVTVPVPLYCPGRALAVPPRRTTSAASVPPPSSASLPCSTAGSAPCPAPSASPPCRSSGSAASAAKPAA